MTDEERGPETPEGPGRPETAAPTEPPAAGQRPLVAARMPSGPALTRIAWFGGLAVAGVVGALEWPVAVGVGSVVAERLAREREPGSGPRSRRRRR